MTGPETLQADILIVGCGAAGMAATCGILRGAGPVAPRILIAERAASPGGVLLQCTHDGFGLGYFGENLTGIEYAARYYDIFRKNADSISLMLSSTVIRIDPDRTALISRCDGLFKVRFDKCILASGCRERTVNSLLTGGTRPSGVMTCGTAQKLLNIDSLDIGDDIVILGTGDIGQIVAMQLIQLGHRVITMIEKEDRPGGLKRNRERCIEAYSIPVMLNSTVTAIAGGKRIEGVFVKHLDSGKEEFIRCGTLLTAVGLIPERDLLPDPLPGWAVAVGNCDYVHDIVDSVTIDGERLKL